ncbi:unnamed protein product [Bursaphelenchus okinawaensis]|uniref:beta-mannosidase n=1 Tax=Bursaphelenchus okinawaensis TaxID=465554 RepID=A0A811KJF8_9BILA|nr:unnamed protein product [Bursaphelenchus okinawaensis]CAG9103761.1 unnamed protein product [Bursaphelenchus okinawaensis]
MGETPIPNDIYTALHDNNFIPDPYFGSNDEYLKWIGRAPWSFFTVFNLTTEEMNKVKVIEFKGVDTIASVTVNQEFVGNTNNMFRTFAFIVNNTILRENNEVVVNIESPVNYAETQFQEYKNITGDEVPPVEAPKVQKGESHFNFIRKTQSSFSWDWGPSFPTVGIYQPVYLHSFDHFKLTQFSPYVYYSNNSFWMTITVYYYCKPDSELNIYFKVEIPEIKYRKKHYSNPKCTAFAQQLTIPEHIVPTNNIKLWYPRGYGSQTMYNITLKTTNGNKKESLTKKIGFKKVLLDQSLVNKDNITTGNNFAYYVNDIPVFLKGANFIPASVFPSKFKEKQLNFLMHSIVEANMNTLRVWGGGEWLRDKFIEAADEMGILIFHDLTFACALYPTNKEFLDNVKKEIKEQVLRLRPHASLLSFSGNNELEAAIRQQWWPSEKYNQTKQIQDYLNLMKPVLETVKRYYPSGVILRSSPSNGGAEMEVDKNPNDELFGDIHYYNEFINLYKTFNLQTPRCATEFGVPSFPLSSTMKKYVNASEYKYFSKAMLARNHHMFGVFTLPLMVMKHFSIQDTESLGSFSYLTQIHQAIALQTQIEHYRSYRSVLTEDGKGHTMCALYWQLNDVWSGITWSTIDFDQRWKVAHYYVKKAFRDVLVSMHLDEHGNLQVFVVNDLAVPLTNAKLTIEAFQLNTEFKKRLLSENKLDVAALSSRKIRTQSYSPDLSDLFLKASLFSYDKLVTSNVLSPDYLSEYLVRDVNVTVTDVVRVEHSTYKLKLLSRDVVPYVWLDLKPRLLTSDIRYHFSDNGFTILSNVTSAYLYILDGDVGDIKVDDISVCWVYNCQ